ncbi:MAG: LysR family transcriptional regulator [Candidatus Protistobacter heckmanni]|nr:LysR family transcriptional regulator [Candidatus Protistobacter heckmanni]
MDRLQSMRVFVKVADSGSFVRAAERLELNNAVVTRHVADLEAHLGAKLLHRTTRTLSLTEVDRAYLEKCRTILDEIDEADAIASARTTQVSGLLRLAAPVSFGMHALGPMLMTFREKHPDMVVDLTLTDRPVDLIEDGYDLALVWESLGLAQGLVGRRLRSDSVGLYAAPGYLENFGIPEGPDELGEAHFCLNLSHTDVREHWMLTGPAGAVKTRVNSGFFCNHVDMLRLAARKGCGITPLPDFMVREDVAAGLLVRVLPDYAMPPLNVSLVYLSRKFMQAKVRALIDHLVEETERRIANGPQEPRNFRPAGKSLEKAAARAAEKAAENAAGKTAGKAAAGGLAKTTAVS